MDETIAQRVFDCLKTEGIAIYQGDTSPIGQIEWERLEFIINNENLKVEVIPTDDNASEIKVARFIVEKGNMPSFVEKNYAEEVFQIVGSSEFIAFLEKATGIKKLAIVRCQGNYLFKNGYIGIHSDNEHYPHYRLSVLLHFDNDYEGGEFVYYKGPRFERKVCNLSKNTVVILLGTVPHEVLKVRSGKRRTIVLFLTSNV